MATDPAYPRMALLIRTAGQLADGTLVDGYKLVQPGDPKYEEYFELAVKDTEYGIPMPYATQEAGKMCVRQRLPHHVKHRISQAHGEGVRVLEKANGDLLRVNGLEVEPLEVALAVEAHRWFWRPSRVRAVLIAESHVYTSREDLSSEMQYDSFPELNNAPREFVRLVYCLGYGEPTLVPAAARPQRGKGGTPQFWDIFATLAGMKEKKPAANSREDNVVWKIEPSMRYAVKAFGCSTHHCTLFTLQWTAIQDKAA